MSDVEYRLDWLTCLEKLSYKKMSHLVEILRMTEEISDCLSRNDRVSVQMVLKSRSEEIDALEEIRNKMQIYSESFSEEVNKEIVELLEGKYSGQSEKEAINVAKYSKNSKSILSDIIKKDKIMSSKLAGKNSFYET